GGVLIGAAAVLLMATLGRIAGISGIAGGLVRRGVGGRGWRLAFVAGLLVGFGTGIGSGCTSGHGVCGVARWSPRSLWATAVFMLFGMATVYVVRHLRGGW